MTERRAEVFINMSFLVLSLPNIELLRIQQSVDFEFDQYTSYNDESR